MSSAGREAPKTSIGRGRALALTSLGHFVNDGLGFFIPVIADIFIALDSLSLFEVGAMLAVFSLSSSLFSVFVGRGADRTGALGKLMALGIGCLGAGMLGFYLVATYTSGTVLFGFALVCNLVMGFGSAFYHPLGASTLQSAFGRHVEGRALGLNGAMGSVGRATYPIIFLVVVAPFLTDAGGFAFFGVVGVVAALMIWAGLGKVGSGSDKKEGAQATVRSSFTRPMVILLGVSFVRSASLYGIAYYAPIFLSNQRGFGIGAQLGAPIFVFYASAIVGQPLFGFLTDRLDHRMVLAISTLGASLSVFGFAGSGGVVSVAWLSLFGLFAYTGFPLLMALASDYSAQNASTFGNSIVWGLGSSGGGALGPVLVSALSLNETGRLGSSFEVLAAVALVTAAATMLIPKPAAKRS